MSNVLIFGASRKGQMAKRALASDFEISGFIDNDQKRQGSSFCDLPIFSLEQARRHFPDMNIVIASQFAVEICEQLIHSGISHFAIYDPQYKGMRTEAPPLRWFDTNAEDSIEPGKVTLLVHNHSGSNTLALAKSGALEQVGLQAQRALDYQKDQRYLQQILTSDVIVTTHETVIRPQTRAIQLWHGFPLKGLNRMSLATDNNTRNKVCQYWQQYRAIGSYSHTYSTLMNACYGANAEQYQITGMPRNDALLSAPATENLCKLLGRNLDDWHIIFYLPTFRKDQFGQVNGAPSSDLFGVPGFELQAFIDLLAKHKILLVVKPHPYQEEDFGMGEPGQLPKQVEVLTEHMFCESGLDLYEVLGAAEMLITDYSSVYFDYLLMDRPILFTPGDLTQYQQNRGMLLEPYDFWAPGPKVTDQETLQKTLLKQLNAPDDGAIQRRQIRDIVHHFQDDQSSQRVAKLIEQLINS
ncbi:CDP-glycerol glycerophosphotransferase family protein [Lacimicrobium alkaliphilum]|uniref:Uncharacterized protein n=1 Tax=Lacimicrobium alkaliphilum TaxID=1526571 RepID=A0ABQ1RMF8_9ALTE|nr:CDP-glycerol glycerophosphotransferase family protein [Lacimicrobium alkaliphilum]GGD72486.1 hypothetical protein GCM10011357_29350 [Lacimicrobium alkaliphilum]